MKHLYRFIRVQILLCGNSFKMSNTLNAPDCCNSEEVVFNFVTWVKVQCKSNSRWILHWQSLPLSHRLVQLASCGEISFHRSLVTCFYWFSPQRNKHNLLASLWRPGLQTAFHIMQETGIVLITNIAKRNSSIKINIVKPKKKSFQHEQDQMIQIS